MDDRTFNHSIPTCPSSSSLSTIWQTRVALLLVMFWSLTFAPHPPRPPWGESKEDLPWRLPKPGPPPWCMWRSSPLRSPPPLLDLPPPKPMSFRQPPEVALPPWPCPLLLRLMVQCTCRWGEEGKDKLIQKCVQSRGVGTCTTRIHKSGRDENTCHRNFRHGKKSRRSVRSTQTLTCGPRRGCQQAILNLVPSCQRQLCLSTLGSRPSPLALPVE